MPQVDNSKTEGKTFELDRDITKYCTFDLLIESSKLLHLNIFNIYKHKHWKRWKLVMLNVAVMLDKYLIETEVSDKCK